jgi:hypothetical protein
MVMAELTIRFGESPWPRQEPTEGVFDFDLRQAVPDAAHGCGIQAILRTPAHVHKVLSASTAIKIEWRRIGPRRGDAQTACRRGSRVGRGLCRAAQRHRRAAGGPCDAGEAQVLAPPRPVPSSAADGTPASA